MIHLRQAPVEPSPVVEPASPTGMMLFALIITLKIQAKADSAKRFAFKEGRLNEDFLTFGKGDEPEGKAEDVPVAFAVECAVGEGNIIIPSFGYRLDYRQYYCFPNLCQKFIIMKINYFYI